MAMPSGLLSDSIPMRISGVMKDPYLCRLCGCKFPDTTNLISIFSNNGRVSEIASKMLYTLSIMISENDPTSKYLCKMCNERLESNYKFTLLCRKHNFESVNNAIQLPHNNIYREEQKKLLKVPFQSLFFNPTVNVQKGYEIVTDYMKKPDASSRSFMCNLEDKILSQFEKKVPSNGFIQIPSPTHSNMCSRINISNGNVNGNTGTNFILRNTNSIPLISIVNRNQIIRNRITISNNIKNDHNSNNDLPHVNGTNFTGNDEIICLDDDDNDDINVSQVVETNVNPLNEWMFNNNNNNNNKVIKPNVSENETKEILKKTLQTKRKLVLINPQSINQNSSSCRTTNLHSSISNVVSEDVTITPDIHMLNMDAVSPFNETENDFREESLHTTNDPPLVTPETGIHFLFAPVETVDLTATESSEKKPRQKRKNKNDNKIPPKKICQKSLIASDDDIVEENNQCLPGPSSQATAQPRITPTKKKICQKSLIASENKEEKKNQCLPGPSSQVTAKLRMTLTKKKICQKTFTVPKNENEKSLSVSSSEAVVKPNRRIAKKCSVPLAPKRFSRRLLLSKPPKSNKKPDSSSSIVTFANESNNHTSLLGVHVNGSWNVDIIPLDLSKYKCPICDVLFDSIISRQNHESVTHFLPLTFSPPSVESVQVSENTSNIEQQEFLLYLNLVKKTPLLQKTMDILAGRPHLLKSLRIVGNTIGSYNCHHCKYTTTRLFILWAHMTSFHNKPIIEKKSDPFCFLCNRYLNKRTKFLKHIEQCVNRLTGDINVNPPPVRHFTCDICNDNFNSSSDLEKHFYNHVAMARQNKKNK